MNPDDIATETIMPEAFLDLARRMAAQKSPEAAATAALAWALRHAPVDGGCTLEISGHRIERIAPEPDPWPTAPLIVATMADEHRTLLMRLNDDTTYENTTRVAERGVHTLTNVVPVTVVPIAELRSARETLAAADAGDFDSLLGSFRALIAATDALGGDL